MNPEMQVKVKEQLTYTPQKSHLSGNCSGLSGNCSGLTGNCSEFRELLS